MAILIHMTWPRICCGRIPPERAEDVIFLIRLTRTDRWGQMHRGPDGTGAAFCKQLHYRHDVQSLGDPHKTGIIGPWFEHAIRNAILTVLEAIPDGTFVEVVQALQRAEFVQEMPPKVTDAIVRRYWTDIETAQTSDLHKSEVLDYIVPKFRDQDCDQ